MRTKAGLALLLTLALSSVALASKPKPMDCDAWSCGEFCAPAKYAKVRHPWMPHWLLSTPVYGAAIIESSALVALFMVGRLVTRVRRANPGSSVDPETLARETKP